MIGRRALLLSGTLALAGCTVGENVQWLPWAAPSPLPVAVPEGLPERVARTAALAALLAGNAAAWKLNDRRVDTLEWFGRAREEQVEVLRSTDPARRQRAATPLPSQPVPSERTASAAQNALVTQLRSLQAAHRTSALATSGPAALLWASLAAFSAVMAARLPAGLTALGDDDATQTPDLTGTGAVRIVQLADQAAYSYELALAATGLNKAATAALRNRLTQWRGLRSEVLTASPGLQPTPPPVGYDQRPARSRAEAWQLAVQTESAALPMFGAWLAGTASAAERRVAVDALVTGTSALVGFGGPALRWPGWPG
ncbi:MAG: DUF4439 domain-containing protein [Micropruina sp.]|uniref:hypothetical protein n=1 Tax=Micropruina sp. TaxID=2737536 RepID=UPI0039E54036